MDKTVKKSVGIKGIIEIPSDKSISHRAAIFSLLCDEPLKIKNFSNGADCKSSLNIVRQLGARVDYIAEKEIIITPPKRLIAPNENLYCGNSGTTMRIMCGYVL